MGRNVNLTGTSNNMFVPVFLTFKITVVFVYTYLYYSSI